MAFYCSCFKHAGVVDNAGQQFVAGTCAHHHDATVGANQAVVLRKAVKDALVDLHADQVAAFKGQCGRASGP